MNTVTFESMHFEGLNQVLTHESGMIALLAVEVDGDATTGKTEIVRINGVTFRRTWGTGDDNCYIVQWQKESSTAVRRKDNPRAVIRDEAPYLHTREGAPAIWYELPDGSSYSPAELDRIRSAERASLHQIIQDVVKSGREPDDSYKTYSNRARNSHGVAVWILEDGRSVRRVQTWDNEFQVASAAWEVLQGAEIIYEIGEEASGVLAAGPLR